MSTDLDIRLGAKAKTLVAKYGKLVTISAPTSVQTNVSTGRTDVLANSKFSVKITPPEGYSQRYVNGTTILAGDLHCYVAGKDLGFIPEKGWSMTVDGRIMRIEDAKRIYSGEDIVLFELQLRGL